MTPKEIVEQIVRPLERRIDHRMDRMESKIDSNTEFKWRIYGGAAIVTAVIGLTFEMMR